MILRMARAVAAFFKAKKTPGQLDLFAEHGAGPHRVVVHGHTRHRGGKPILVQQHQRGVEGRPAGGTPHTAEEHAQVAQEHRAAGLHDRADTHEAIAADMRGSARAADPSKDAYEAEQAYRNHLDAAPKDHKKLAHLAGIAREKHEGAREHHRGSSAYAGHGDKARFHEQRQKFHDAEAMRADPMHVPHSMARHAVTAAAAAELYDEQHAVASALPHDKMPYGHLADRAAHAARQFHVAADKLVGHPDPKLSQEARKRAREYERHAEHHSAEDAQRQADAYEKKIGENYTATQKGEKPPHDHGTLAAEARKTAEMHGKAARLASPTGTGSYEMSKLAQHYKGRAEEWEAEAKKTPSAPPAPPAVKPPSAEAGRPKPKEKTADTAAMAGQVAGPQTEQAPTNKREEAKARIRAQADAQRAAAGWPTPKDNAVRVNSTHAARVENAYHDAKKAGARHQDLRTHAEDARHAHKLAANVAHSHDDPAARAFHDARAEHFDQRITEHSNKAHEESQRRPKTPKAQEPGIDEDTVHPDNPYVKRAMGATHAYEEEASRARRNGDADSHLKARDAARYAERVHRQAREVHILADWSHDQHFKQSLHHSDHARDHERAAAETPPGGKAYWTAYDAAKNDAESHGEKVALYKQQHQKLAQLAREGAAASKHEGVKGLLHERARLHDENGAKYSQDHPHVVEEQKHRDAILQASPVPGHHRHPTQFQANQAEQARKHAAGRTIPLIHNAIAFFDRTAQPEKAEEMRKKLPGLHKLAGTKPGKMAKAVVRISVPRDLAF